VLDDHDVVVEEVLHGEGLFFKITFDGKVGNVRLFMESN
jgi:hypothetical protein